MIDEINTANNNYSLFIIMWIFLRKRKILVTEVVCQSEIPGQSDYNSPTSRVCSSNLDLSEQTRPLRTYKQPGIWQVNF